MLNKKIFVIAVLFTFILCGCNTFKRISCENVIIKGIDSSFFPTHNLIFLENEKKEEIMVISKKKVIKDSSINQKDIISLASSKQQIDICIEKLDGTEGISLNAGYIRAYSIILDGIKIYEGGKFYNIFKSKNFDGLFYYQDKYK